MLEHDSPAAVEEVAGPVSAPGLGFAFVKALQRGAGNAAVARAVAVSRQPVPAVAPPPPPVAPVAGPVTKKTALEIQALTLSDFHAFARDQADWHGELVKTDKKGANDLRALLEFAESGKTQPVLSACAQMTVKSLLDAKVTTTNRQAILTYSLANSGESKSVQVERAADATTAISWGVALGKLEKGITAALARKIVKQRGPQTQLQDLIDEHLVDGFVTYATTVHPMLVADNGTEVDSYIALRKEKADPVAFAGRVPHVRNFHHFHRATLEALAKNWGDTSRKRPLALVLHAGVDHNGAFHRDEHMREVIVDSHNLALMIEGAGSIEAAEKLIAPIAKRYGRGGKIEQVLIAGHGESRVMELAGKEGKDGSVKQDDLDLDDPKTKDRTTHLINTLLDNMKKSPDARIVLNGCLTSSVNPGQLDPDPVKAKQQVTDAVNNKPSIADTIQDLATKKGFGPGTVSAANASFTADAKLIDPATGKIGLNDPADPKLTSANKLEYVEDGVEPEGAMRAVLQMWASDPVATEAAMKARQGKPLIGTPIYGWWDRTVHGLYSVALSKNLDPGTMSALTGAARGVGELVYEEECRPSRLLPLAAAFRPTVFSYLSTSQEYLAGDRVSLVMDEVQGLDEPKFGERFLDALGAKWTCQSASPYVSVGVLTTVLGKLLVRPSGHAAGALRLALIDVFRRGDKADAASIAYLRAERSGALWSNEPDIVSALGGLAKPDAILASIRESAPGAAPPEAFNVDLDGDGTNDFRVEELTRRGAVAANALNVRAKPGTGEAVVGSVVRGARVIVIGRSGDWFAIEHAGKTRFVDASHVKLLE